MSIFKAIMQINPEAEFTYADDDINKIVWMNGTTPIPKADIEAKINEIASGPESSNYIEQRKAAYPPIGDQLDMLWHSIDQNAELKQKYFAFYEAIKAVKAKYPK